MSNIQITKNNVMWCCRSSSAYINQFISDLGFYIDSSVPTVCKSLLVAVVTMVNSDLLDLDKTPNFMC